MPSLDITFIDAPISAGDVRYVGSASWLLGGFGTARRRYDYLEELRSGLWMPADYDGEWLLDRQVTGRRRWLQGSQHDAEKDGYEVPAQRRSGRWRARRGAFFGDEVIEPSWQTPTPQFLDVLPLDLNLLHNTLTTATRENRPGPDGVLAYGLDALRSELVAAPLRSALIQVFMMLPNTSIEYGAATPDGRAAAELIHLGPMYRHTLFIEQSVGLIVAERTKTTTDGFRGLPQGTVTKEVVTTRMVTHTLGEVPVL